MLEPYLIRKGLVLIKLCLKLHVISLLSFQHTFNHRFGFQWPESLECSKFPVSGLCVGENKTEHVDSGRPPGGGVTPNGPIRQGDIDNFYPNKTWPGKNNKRFGVECPKQFHVSASYDYKLQIDHNILKNCGMPCNDDIFFGSRERLFAKYWIGVSLSFNASV